MLPLSATSTATTTLGTIVTVNPYAYLAALTHGQTYALLFAAAVFGALGAVLIQRDAAVRLLRRARQ